MTDRQTVRIYCAGKPTTATLDLACLEYHCDSCGNVIRRVVVWDRNQPIRKKAKQ